MFIDNAAKPTFTRSRKLTKYNSMTNGMIRSISLRDTRLSSSEVIVSSCGARLLTAREPRAGRRWAELIESRLCAGQIVAGA
ncbi:hypothetical protein [Paraburkholderia sp. 35.1]|uniref:hypothetical protein n=1 Tax=Paraburkholderia sp. 35.1 TaxID=2991058 RepID=UPI003D1E38CD